MKYTINPVELASNLAHESLVRTIGENNMYQDECIGTKYKPSVQSKFDDHYDFFYNQIVKAL